MGSAAELDRAKKWTLAGYDRGTPSDKTESGRYVQNTSITSSKVSRAPDRA
jgi:hypothetical protein